MIYFSPSLMAFYDDAVHGARMIAVVDQTVLDAGLKDIRELEDPLLAAPEGELPDGREARLEALAEIDEMRAWAVANPPVNLEPNPDCRIPEDAVEVSAERHAHLMEGQGKGLVIGWDDTVKSTVLKERPVDVAALIAGVKKERDRLLRASDWTQLPDNELDKADRAAWKAWRQDVRNHARGFEMTDPSIMPPLEDVFPPAPGEQA